MKRCITLLSLGLCLAAPMLSNANDIRPLIHVTNIHNGQYDEGLDSITETKFFGPYQFRVLKDSVETKGETKDIDGRAFRTSDGVFMHVKVRTIDNTSATLDNEIEKIVKDRTVPEPTAKMVLVTDYEDTRYYYKLQFYRDKLPNGVRIEQLRQMIMDARFSYK